MGSPRTKQPSVLGGDGRGGGKIAGATLGTLLTTYGTWGRDGVLLVAVRYGRHRLPELLEQLPGVRYSDAAQAIQRFGRLVHDDVNRSRSVERFRRGIDKVSNDQTRPHWFDRRCAAVALERFEAILEETVAVLQWKSEVKQFLEEIKE